MKTSILFAAVSWDWLLDILKQAFQWVIEFVQWFGGMLLVPVFNVMELVMPISYVNAFAEVLGKADYFFPVRECIAFGSAYFVMWGALALYRLIKSFIPAVAT